MKKILFLSFVVCAVALAVLVRSTEGSVAEDAADEEQQLVPDPNPSNVNALFIGIATRDGVASVSGNVTCRDNSSLDDFPEDLFTEEQRLYGAILLHLLAAAYCFTLLALVCDGYFLPSVECICIDLNIPKDVAAATFMATATTMPEFFTNSISTLITESDMGIGTIIGSLMFNTLGVAAISGVAINKSVQLDWWPVSRDCIFYCFNTLLLIVVCWGGVVTFMESLVMVIFCITYFLTMFLNNTIMKRVRVLIEDNFNCCLSTRYDFTVPPEKSAKAKLPLEKYDPHHHGIFTIILSDYLHTITEKPKEPTFKIEMDHDHEKDQKDTVGLFTIPKGSWKTKLWWGYTLPLKTFLTCFVPSPKVHRKFYPITFLMCIALIGCNSYIIVWMLTIVGTTYGIPDTVMGLTFLAAGATMPEALSSLMAIRSGEGGIGVSNALGANSLSILLSLGFPWFIKNAVHYNDPLNNVININSQAIEYTIGILLLSTASLFIILTVAGFRLRRRVGLALFIVYGVYITLQILIEMKVLFPVKNFC